MASDCWWRFLAHLLCNFTQRGWGTGAFRKISHTVFNNPEFFQANGLHA